MSERNLKRLLGLEAKRTPETRDHTIDDLARVSGITPELIYCLAAYDLFDPEDGRFGYRDLVAARELRRLLAHGAELAEIVKASHLLLNSGHSLADTHLTVLGGELVQSASESTGGLDGQFALALGDNAQNSGPSLVERAAECELSGDLPGAEHCYRAAIVNAPCDPLPHFKLGVVLEALGHSVTPCSRTSNRSATMRISWTAG
jgi:hypothetical protein